MSLSLIVPYINANLSSPIELLPEQMNNDYKIHLLNNLKKKLLNKCYKEYGYITHIYGFPENEEFEGKINYEDQNCGAIFFVKFLCRLCIPIINKQIICQVNRFSRTILKLVNGPIITIVTFDKINIENFIIDDECNIYIKDTDNINQMKNELTKDHYVVVTIESKLFNDMDAYIMTIGYMDRVATQYEIENFYNVK